jgi:hypothetical protein
MHFLEDSDQLGHIELDETESTDVAVLPPELAVAALPPELVMDLGNDVGGEFESEFEGDLEGDLEDDEDELAAIREDLADADRRQQAIDVIRAEARSEFGDDRKRVGEFTADFAFALMGKLSARELARAFGVSRQQVYRRETQALDSAERAFKRRFAKEDLL